MPSKADSARGPKPSYDAPNIAGILGECVNDLAIANAEYYVARRDFAITGRRIAPDGSIAGEPGPELLGPSAEQLEQRDLCDRQESFRSALFALAAALRQAREQMIELLENTIDHTKRSDGISYWEGLLNIASQFERCSDRCNFRNPNLPQLPSRRKVLKLIGEIETLVALVQAFCRTYGLKLNCHRG
jgi:hypothetical protein